MGPRLVMLLALSLLGSSPAFAGLVEYRATGVIVDFEDQAGLSLLGCGVGFGVPCGMSGDEFTATLIVDPDIPDLSASNETVGLYPQGPGTFIQMHFNNLMFTGAPQRVNVTNDFQTETGDIDTFQAFDNFAAASLRTLDGEPGPTLASVRLSFSLYDFSGAAFDDDSFPELLELADFTDFPYVEATAPDTIRVAGRITSLVLVPEPSAAALLAVAVCALLFRASGA